MSCTNKLVSRCVEYKRKWTPFSTLTKHDDLIRSKSPSVWPYVLCSLQLASSTMVCLFLCSILISSEIIFLIYKINFYLDILHYLKLEIKYLDIFYQGGFL